jgi:dienelactone hydrolase
MNTSLLTLLVLCIFHTTYSQEVILCQGAYWSEDEANLRMKEFAKTWNDKASWEARESKIRSVIIEGMKLDQMPVIEGQFNPIIRHTREMDGYIVENIVIESFPGFYITGNLYRPAASKSRQAGILCPHGHWTDGRMRESMQIRCAALARMGAVVIAYDMIGFGESQQVDHHIPLALLLQTWNSQRVLSYLLARPDIDPERIGITGASGGGTQTFILAAVDSRIKVAVPAVMVAANFFGGCVCESGMPIHARKGHQTNNVEIAALCAPRPLLLLSDGGDWTRNTPRLEYPYIQKVYALYDAEHKVQNVHFPAERHDYGYSKRTAAYIFLAHNLGLDINKIPYKEGIKEDFVTVLPQDDLKVYSPDNPVPENALQGDDEVMNYLGIH